MLYKNTTVSIDTHHAFVLKAKAAEAGVSMKLMLESVLRETWPEAFRIADERLEARRASFSNGARRHNPN